MTTTTASAGARSAAPSSGQAWALLWTRVGLPGLAATSLIALGALGVGWIAPASDLASSPVVQALRDSSLAVALSKVAVVVGVGWLLRVWLNAAGSAADLDVAGARRLGAMALVWSTPLVMAPVLFSRDVFSYIALSRLGPAGIDPYSQGTGALPTYWLDGADPMWHDSPSPYGPVWTSLSSLTYHLTSAEPTAALLTFRLWALVGVGLLVLFVPVLARLAGANPGRAAWLAVLNPLVVFHFVSAAHNDALMVGLLVAGLALALQNRPVAAVLLITAAGAVKAPALLALPFVALMWAGATPGWWPRLVALAKTGLIAVTTLLVISLPTGSGWVANLSTPTKVDTWLSPVTALGRTLGLAVETVTDVSADAVLDGVRTAGLVATVALIAYLLATAERRSPLQGLTVAMLALVVLGPVVQPWYLLWVLPLVSVTAATPRQVRLIAVASVGMAAYTVANTAATTTSLAALPDGLALLLALGTVALMLYGPRGTRALLVAPRERAAEPALAPA